MTAPLLRQLSDARPRPALWLSILLGTQVAALSFNFAKVGLTSEGGTDIGRLLVIAPGQVFLGVLLLCISPPLLRLLRRQPATAVMAWLLWNVTTVFWSIDLRQTTILGIGAINLFLIAAWLVHHFGIRVFADISGAAISLVVAGGAYWQWIGPDGPGFGARFEGLSQGFNQQGILCAFGFTFVLITLKETGDHLRLRVAAAVALFLALVATGGRTSLLATAITTAILFHRQLFSARYRRFVLAAGAIGAGFLFSVISSADLYGRPDDAGSLNGRNLIWAHAIDKILEEPLVGHGMMAGEAIWEAAVVAGKVNFAAGSAHNSFLEAAVGGGIIGLALFLIAIGVTLGSLIRSRNEIGVAMVTLVLLTGLTESLVHRPTLMHWILGAAVAIAISARDETEKPTSRFNPVVPVDSLPVLGTAKVGRYG